MVRLGFLHCAHGITSQGGNFFLATGLEPGAPEREHEEQDMRQAWVPRTGFDDMITDGLITDDSTLAAYALLLISERGPAGLRSGALSSVLLKFGFFRVLRRFRLHACSDRSHGRKGPCSLAAF
jgi:hypothetical protein